MIIGVGNLDRGDDAAGRLAARALRHRLSPHVSVYDMPGEAAGLLAKMTQAPTVFFYRRLHVWRASWRYPAY